MQRQATLAESFFAPAAVEVTRRADGCILLRSPEPLEFYGRCVGDWLMHWANAAANRVFLAERAPDGRWRKITYAEALDHVRSIGAWLLDQGCSVTRPVAVLCENSIAHALITLASMHVGVPVAPVSSAYSLASTDHSKLKNVIGQIRPGALLVSDISRFARALAAIEGLHDGRVISADGETDSLNITPWTELTSTAGQEGVERAFVNITPDTVAKLLFTSGSTGTPKAVITTHRMLLANQQQIVQAWPFLRSHVPTLVDWLPWSHTFGGSHNFNMVLRWGGALFIDEGRPVPQRFAQSIRNLRDVAPSLYFNVPRGFDMLLPVLREDESFREQFFSRLELLFFAAAALPQHVWESLRQLSSSPRRRTVPMVSAWGATEVAPVATVCHFEARNSAVIGLPVAGVDLKLVPSGSKLEVRIKGPNVTPGYWGRPDLSQAAFDEEGFYRIGDAVKPVDAGHYEQGLMFDGRVSEDFKLASGTWVNVGATRLRTIAALAPLVQDAVITGHDRDSLGLLLFPNIPACRQVCSDLPADAPLTQVLCDKRIRDKIQGGLREMRAEGRGSSTFATRAILMAEPASIDAGEITDKGYINQRAVLESRQALVALIYAPTVGETIIVMAPDS